MIPAKADPEQQETFLEKELTRFWIRQELNGASNFTKNSILTGYVYHILLDEMQTDAAQLYF